MLAETALSNAIKYCGGKQKMLADLIGEDPDKISYWLNRGKRIPFHSAVAIEKATQGKVSRYDLAPYARIHKKPVMEQKMLSDTHDNSLSISDRVSIGVSLEKLLRNPKGVRNDLMLLKKYPELSPIWDQVAGDIPQSNKRAHAIKGNTAAFVAKHIGFSSRNTYLRARSVLNFGIFQLVEAMDKKIISIATAAAISELPPSAQESLLSKSKKEILALIQKKSCQQKTPASTLAFLKNEPLKAAERQHRLPFRLILIVLLLECDASDHFPWQVDAHRLDLLAHVSLDIESILTQLMELGWIKKITYKQKVLGQLIQRKDN